MKWPRPEVSRKWTHIIGTLCVAHFTQHIVLKILLCRSIHRYQNVPPPAAAAAAYCICVLRPHSVYSLPVDGHLACFCIVATVNGVILNTGAQVSV